MKGTAGETNSVLMLRGGSDAENMKTYLAADLTIYIVLHSSMSKIPRTHLQTEDPKLWLD